MANSVQPRMLKDFLQDKNVLSFPQKPRLSNFINAIKYLPFTSVKAPSILPRSISRRLSKRKKHRYDAVVSKVAAIQSVTVTVKDILRWKSFRDLDVEEEDPPLDFTTSLSHCTTATTADSPRSSWCDRDFTAAEDSPLWCGTKFSGETVIGGKQNLQINGVGGAKLTGDRKEQLSHEEQHSPVSVLDFSLQEDESFSSFHQTLATLERRRLVLVQILREFENLAELEYLFLVDKSIALEEEEEEANRVEEMANHLLNLVKGTSSIEGCETNVDHLLLDFFRDELITCRKSKGNVLDAEKLRLARAWVRGEDDGSLEWEMVGKREVCVRDMEERGRWNNFEEEQEEVAIEIETKVLNFLLEELAIDLFNH